MHLWCIVFRITLEFFEIQFILVQSPKTTCFYLHVHCFSKTMTLDTHARNYFFLMNNKQQQQRQKSSICLCIAFWNAKKIICKYFMKTSEKFSFRVTQETFSPHYCIFFCFSSWMLLERTCMINYPSLTRPPKSSIFSFLLDTPGVLVHLSVDYTPAWWCCH